MPSDIKCLDEIDSRQYDLENCWISHGCLCGFCTKRNKKLEKSDMYKNEMNLQKGNHKCATKYL